MKIFCFVLAAMAVSVGAADTIYVEIKTKNTESFPSAAMVQFGSLLPMWITGLLPDSLKTYGSFFAEIPLVSSVDPATKVGSIKAYFPKVPIQLKAVVEPQLNTFVKSTSFKDQMSAILPGFLQCGACQYDSAGIGVESPTNPVVPPVPTAGEIVGVKMLLKGATAEVSQALLDAAKAALPGLLDTQFANLNLPSSTLAVIKQIVQSLDVKQHLQTTAPAGLWIKVIFTGVDQSVAALYEPLIKQYVIDNDAVKAFLKSTTVSTLFNCVQGCSIDEITLIEDSVPITKKSTMQPSVSPTTSPTTSPTMRPTVSPTTSPTVPPTAKDDDQNASSQGAQITVTFFVAMALIWA